MSTESVIELVRTNFTNALPPPTPVEPPHSLTAVFSIYHQEPDRDATGMDSRFSRTLASKEQPYERRTRIGDEWTPLETGWINDPGLVGVRNDGTQFRVNPTEVERIEAARKTLVLALAGDNGEPQEFAEIPPGESLTISPRGIVRWRVKCASGSVVATVFAFPK